MEDPLLIRHEPHEPHRHPTHEEIAVAAYYIWLKEIEDPSHFAILPANEEAIAIGNWLAAEDQLRGRFDLVEGS